MEVRGLWELESLVDDGGFDIEDKGQRIFIKVMVSDPFS